MILDVRAIEWWPYPGFHHPHPSDFLDIKHMPSLSWLATANASPITSTRPYVPGLTRTDLKRVRSFWGTSYARF